MNRRLCGAVVAVALCSCCNSPPRVDSCASPLAGVWRDGASKRYHAMEERGRVDLYPMFNAARINGDIVYAPYMFGFARSVASNGQTLVGKRSQRVTRKGNTCTVRTLATIADCHSNKLTLRYTPAGEIDWARCKPAAARQQVTVVLTR